MKKILNLLLVFGLCFSLVGCNQPMDSSEKKDTDEIKNILEDNNYKTRFSSDGNMVYILDTNDPVCLCAAFKKEKLNVLNIYESNKFHQISPQLSESGKTMFQKYFENLDLTVDDITDYITWFFENKKSTIDKTSIDFSTITTDRFIEELKSNNIPIDNVITYDESSDPNSLLGKENEYIAKVDFADTRLEQFNASDPEGGTIEIFKNYEDAKTRYDYINSVASSGPLSMYMYLQGNTLVRLSKQITSDDLNEYEKVLLDITRGYIFESTNTSTENSDVYKMIQLEEKLILNKYEEYDNHNWSQEEVIDGQKLTKHFNTEYKIFTLSDEYGNSVGYQYDLYTAGIGDCNYDYKTDTPKEGSTCSSEQLTRIKNARKIFLNEMGKFNITEYN